MLKKIVPWFTFITLLIIIIQVKLRADVIDNRTGPYLLMLLALIAGVFSGGLLMGISMLTITLGVISYIFLTPFDLLQFDARDFRQIVLLLLQGLFVIFLIHILRKAKEQEHSMREQFQVILSSIGDSVIATDRNGRITYMNARSQKVMGIRFHNAKNKHILDVFTLKVADKKEEFFSSINKVLHEGKTTTFNAPITFKTQRKREWNFQYTMAPLRNMEGQIIGVVLIFRDVSEHKDMETQREVLLGSISHELKNHMTSIQGYAHILQKKLGQGKQVEHITLIEKLNAKIGVMTEMITGMLDLSKIKVGKFDMNIEDFDLIEVVVSIVNDQRMNSGREIILKGGIVRQIKADKIRIGQVLTNLITNAIKYSPAGTKITVSIEQQDNEAIVAVKDRGQGISAGQIARIFQPFYRATNVHDRAIISGSGLGLYISREIVKQNGGDIWVESIEGKGSTFYFSLPLADQLDVVSKTSEQGIMEKLRGALKLQYVR